MGEKTESLESLTEKQIPNLSDQNQLLLNQVETLTTTKQEVERQLQQQIQEKSTVQQQVSSLATSEQDLQNQLSQLSQEHLQGKKHKYPTFLMIAIVMLHALPNWKHS